MKTGRGTGKEPGKEGWSEEGGGGDEWKRRPEAERQVWERPSVLPFEAGVWAARPCPQRRFIPVGVEAVEWIRAMTRGQLAAEVADVQAAWLLAGAGAHPARGSQKREGLLGG